MSLRDISNAKDFLLTNKSNSTPVPMQFEKFYIPDPIRILDAVTETLTF